MSASSAASVYGTRTPILSASWVAGDGGAPVALGLVAVQAAAMSMLSEAANTRLVTLISAAPSLPELKERRPTAGAPSSRERYLALVTKSLV